MIYLELVWGFLQVGCLAFGGAYAAIPFIREVVLHYGWLDEASIAYIIAVSESTPGPIMVNMATYVGQQQGGLLGSFLATLAVVTPAFFVTIVIMCLLYRLLSNPWFKTCINGLMPGISGIIIATGLIFLVESLSAPGASQSGAYQIGGCQPGAGVPCTFPIGPWMLQGMPCLIGILLIAVQCAYKKWRQSAISPIAIIAISALLGAILVR